MVFAEWQWRLIIEQKERSDREGEALRERIEGRKVGKKETVCAIDENWKQNETQP